MKHICISHQRATYLSWKYAGCKVPPIGEAWLMPHGVKLANVDGKYVVYGYAYDHSDLLAFCDENNIGGFVVVFQ